MKLIDGTQVYHILQNLNNLEISFMEYSRSQKNFLKYDTYLEFFDNYIIKSQNLSRFYFPSPMDGNITMPKQITSIFCPDVTLLQQNNLTFPIHYGINATITQLYISWKAKVLQNLIQNCFTSGRETFTLYLLRYIMRFPSTWRVSVSS